MGIESHEIKRFKQVKESLKNNGTISNEWVSVFILQGDFNISEMKLQEEEVSEAKWSTCQELEQLIKEGKIIPHVYFKDLIELLSNKNKDEVTR